MAATVLFGTTAAASFAQEYSRDTDEYGFRRTTSAAPADDAQVASVYDDFGYSKSSRTQSATSAQEVNQLRSEVRHLKSLCADLYDQVETAPRDEQDVRFVSMMSRLETQAGCFEESSCCVPAPAPCCEPSCDTCCCQPCGYCYAGFEALFVKPYVKDDVAYISDPPPDDNNVHSFSRDWEFTPRVWLGYTNACGTGVRATYWQLDSDTGPISVLGTANNTPIYVQVIGASTGIGRNAFADVGETFISGASLQMNVLDGEITKEWRRGPGSYVMLSGGLRFADMDQRFQATVFDAVGALSEQVIHTHGFTGFGPTVGVNGVQSFGQSPWGVYGRARASFLFGERDQEIYEVKNGGADIGQDRFEGDEVLTVGELGFGLQYTHAINGTYSGFVRAGYEGQIWFDAGGPTSTSGDLGLHGLLVGFGIEG